MKHKTIIEVELKLTQQVRVSDYSDREVVISKVTRRREFEGTAKDAKSAFNVLLMEAKAEANELQQSHIEALIVESDKAEKEAA